MSELVRYHFDNVVSTIIFDDGKANVMSVAMLESLNRALDQAERDGGPVVLAGRENMFSGGFDLKVFQQGGEPLLKMLQGGAAIAERLQNFPVPVVAACTGHAIAMGVFLLLSCDYRIGPTTDCRISANEVEIGLTVPHFAIETCRQRLTPAGFHRAVNTAESFSGERAVAAGFLDELVPPNEVASAAIRKAQQFSRLNCASYLATKNRAKDEYFRRLRDAIENDIQAWQAGQA